MDLRGYIGALTRNWLIIIGLVVIGAAVSFGAYKLTPATYASTVTFYVATPLSDGSNAQAAGQFAESRVNSYALLLQSDRLADEVAESTGIDAANVRGTITASAQPSTVLLNATISTGSAQQADQIAAAVADVLPKMVDELDNQDSTRTTVQVSTVSGPTDTVQVAPSLKKYLVIGLAAGLFVGVVIALLRELLDVSVRSVDAATALVGAPVIGTIDRDSSTKKAPLIVGDAATSPRSEAFRQLRANFHYIDTAEPTDVLLVTSSVPLEGKSTVASDLALALVESGSRVLLIDGDLRRPSVAEIFGVEQSIGLTNVLVGRVTIDDAIQSWGPKGPDVLTSGGLPPNPSELLGTAKMKDLIQQLRGRYDKVIIDAPPLLPVADAVVAAELADGVLFVLRHGKTSRSAVRNSARILHGVDARIVGVVLNMRRPSRRERSEYAGYQTAGGVVDQTAAEAELDVPTGISEPPPRPTIAQASVVAHRAVGSAR